MRYFFAKPTGVFSIHTSKIISLVRIIVENEEIGNTNYASTKKIVKNINN